MSFTENYGRLQELDEEKLKAICNLECDAEQDDTDTTVTINADLQLHHCAAISNDMSSTEESTAPTISETSTQKTETNCCAKQTTCANGGAERGTDSNVSSDGVSDRISFDVREDAMDITIEHGALPEPQDDAACASAIEGEAGEEDAVRSAQLQAMADDSSSLKRVLAWDPWAGLTALKGDAAPPEPPPPPADQCEVRQASAPPPVASILKGSPRRVSSAAGGSTCNTGEDNRFELLPIGDSVVDKHVQWRHEVEVTYYAVDSEGRIVLTTEVEPLHEEPEQQARSLQFARSNSKNLNMVPVLEDWLPELNLNK